MSVPLLLTKICFLHFQVNIKAARFLNPKNSLQDQVSFVHFPEQHSNYINQQSLMIPLQKIKFEHVRRIRK